MFDMKNIIPNGFDMILRCIYIGKLDLIEQSSEDIFGWLIASDKLFVLVIALKLTNCEKLSDYILISICKDSYSFITSNKFLF
ncbi:hypothetical protein GLOIN_2v1768263 [Rhizophagus clarus]|uniref:BTB domain-containing protein n=1 Tax=Rhizophagus clarus TaxID=94130 RepID=A0A8H3L9K1_9GLOM|nr:hypothetical protein GLOIN_2v1768263 [Rhizophagus clarus]